MLSGILSYLDPIQCGDWWCDTAWVNWMKNIPKYSFVRSSLALQKWAMVIAWDMGKCKRTRHHHSFKRSLARSMWAVFTGIWALVLSDTNPIESRSNDLRDPRAHFLPNRTSSRVWPVTKPANKTNAWAEAGKLGHRDKNKYKQDKVNNADSAFIFLIIQSQNQWSSWSGRRIWSGLVWSLLER